MQVPFSNSGGNAASSSKNCGMPVRGRNGPAQLKPRVRRTISNEP